jgi:hypothetical protein
VRNCPLRADQQVKPRLEGFEYEAAQALEALMETQTASISQRILAILNAYVHTFVQFCNLYGEN